MIFNRKNKVISNTNTSNKNIPSQEDKWFMIMQQCDEMETIKSTYEIKMRDIEDKIEEYTVLYNHYTKKSGKSWNGTYKDERAADKSIHFDKLKKKKEIELDNIIKHYDSINNKYDESYKEAEELRKLLFYKKSNPLK